MTMPTILLTGAARGIGRATALALAAKGCKLGLIDRTAGPLEETAAELSSRGITVFSAPADVTDPEGLLAAVRELEGKLGAIDVLVACAGIGGLTQVPNLDLDGLRAMLEVNVVGVARSIEAVLPGMIERKSGHIVGVSSVAGFRGMPWMASYSASKAALSAYLEALRPALKLRGVTITTACPGFVRTALTADTPFRNPVKMMEPEEAGRYLARAALRKPRNCVFPASTAIGMSFLRHTPDRIFDWMMDRAGPRALTTDF
ncbi:SDR family NAD(P)-dependent oxidoreductase [Tundrisphaera lichenicola]|uniref:SDR family NAD(P)-dependent oxidoreductase n=1 Tax=Tundrisphaera lichenicola TaxID=2029860 RepID=UPI003EC01C8F